jgi:hypothetical protein
MASVTTCECRILKQEALDRLKDMFRGMRSQPCISEAAVCALVDEKVNGVLTDINDLYWETVHDAAAHAAVCNPP